MTKKDPEAGKLTKVKALEKGMHPTAKILKNHIDDSKARKHLRI
jgi:hypothetical protein